LKNAALFLGLFVVLGCASANTPPIGISLEQVNTTPDMYYFAGPVNIQYQLSITNPTNETYRLRRLDLRTISPGAYSLRTPVSLMNVTIPPGKTVTVNLSAWGRSSGSYLHAEEPVTIQGTAHFEGPNGNFVKIFQQMLPQHG
jgi:hypothetical protein